MALELSIVIPAYNESQRIGIYLESICRYLTTERAPKTEIIVVDDGSTDSTSDVLEGWSRKQPNIRCLRHPLNRGKGAAVRTGLLAAEGRLILFADADGATPIEEEQRLRTAIQQGADLAIGSRMLPGTARCQRLLGRRIAGYFFSQLVQWSISVPVRDTQCGFKMLRRDTILPIAYQCANEGYLFDIELLARVHRAGLSICEIAISWRDIPGSKIRLIRDSLLMWRGLKTLQSTLKTIQSTGGMNE